MDEWIASLESTFTEIASMVERVGEFKDVVEAVRKQSSEVAKLSDGVNEYIAMVDETKAYMDTQSKALKEALALAKEILTLMEARTRSVSWDTDGYVLLACVLHRAVLTDHCSGTSCSLCRTFRLSCSSR